MVILYEFTDFLFVHILQIAAVSTVIIFEDEFANQVFANNLK